MIGAHGYSEMVKNGHTSIFCSLSNVICPFTVHALKRAREDSYALLGHINNVRRSPKIIISKLALGIEGFLDVKGEYASINTNCIHTPQKGYSLDYLAGVINSKLMRFVYSELFSGLRMSKGYFQFQVHQLRVLPIAKASDDEQRRVAVLVYKIMILNDILNWIGDKKTVERTRIEEQINKIDSQIDNAVYKVYRITHAEKKTIENGLQ